MKKKQFEISTNDRVSVFIELADAYRQLGQQVCTLRRPFTFHAFSALTPLVGRLEGHPRVETN